MSVMSTSGTTNLIIIVQKKKNDVGRGCQAFIDSLFYIASIILFIHQNVNYMYT